MKKLERFHSFQLREESGRATRWQAEEGTRYWSILDCDRNRWFPNLGMMKAAFSEVMGGRKLPIKTDIRFCCENATK